MRVHDIEDAAQRGDHRIGNRDEAYVTRIGSGMDGLSGDGVILRSPF
jgi:hypothetical protein